MPLILRASSRESVPSSGTDLRGDNPDFESQPLARTLHGTARPRMIDTMPEPEHPLLTPSADLCPHGCYWDCEHRTASSASPTSSASPASGSSGDADAPGAGRTPSLRPVHDDHGRALNRCRECGDFFYGVLEHSREHARKRQLGWLPERPLEGWPR